jgi:lysine 2,3-aminomutase
MVTEKQSPAQKESLPVLNDGEEPIIHLRPKVKEEDITWRNPRRDAFWQKIPAWKNIDEKEFLNYRWQEKNAITKPEKFLSAVQDLVSDQFIEDIKGGFAAAPMAVRISPYLLSLVDWDNAYADPIRRQFLPVKSQLEADHPMLTLDSLHEQSDAPVPGLTHRYPDKALFLTLDTCPVYCRFCTRSYAVGLDTDQVEKVSIKATEERWKRALQYIRERKELEDVVISGGDAYRLRPEQIRLLGESLLAIPHIRRFRFATKGLAIQPMKVLTHHEWTDAITEIVEKGRKMHKEVCIHTHFNHANEVTGISQDALNLLFERGIIVRNQSVFQHGVNDSTSAMIELTRRLSYINVQSYYVYIHDLVRGTEDLRTPLSRALEVEKSLRGTTAGFNTPTFVVDAPGGGGKRAAHSFELYDAETGISVYTAPSVKPGQFFLYFDPARSLSPGMRAAWQDKSKRDEMIRAATEKAAAQT